MSDADAAPPELRDEGVGGEGANIRQVRQVVVPVEVQMRRLAVAAQVDPSESQF